MVNVSASIEDYRLDALLFRAIGDRFADEPSPRDIAAASFGRGGGSGRSCCRSRLGGSCRSRLSGFLAALLFALLGFVRLLGFLGLFRFGRLGFDSGGLWRRSG